MLWALVEGLAGIVDDGCGFDAVTLAPRWLAAGLSEAEASVCYAASGRGVGYAFRHAGDRLDIEVEADRADVRLHILLPAGRDVRGVHHGTLDVPFRRSVVEASRYADFEAHVDGSAGFTISLQ